MHEKDIRLHSEKALAFIREQNTLDALFHLDRIMGSVDTPEIMSAYALCIALERGKVKEGIDLCIQAIKKDPENTFHYLNLGKIYLKANKKAVAIDIFRKGMKYSPESESSRAITVILNELGLRKKPLFPFLARDHVLNKYLGLVLSRLGLR